MTVKRARIVFAVLMQAAREGKHLTQYDKQQLSIARQTLRQIRKPVMNPKMPTLKQIKAKSIGSVVGGGYLASFTTYERAEFGKHILEEWGGLHVGDVKQSKSTGDYLVFFGVELGRNPKQQSNPKTVLIYGRVNRVVATKTQKHICDAECKRHGHKYYHDFSSKPQMYGLPDGSLLIKSR